MRVAVGKLGLLNGGQGRVRLEDWLETGLLEYLCCLPLWAFPFVWQVRRLIVDIGISDLNGFQLLSVRNPHALHRMAVLGPGPSGAVSAVWISVLGPTRRELGRRQRPTVVCGLAQSRLYPLSRDMVAWRCILLLVVDHQDLLQVLVLRAPFALRILVVERPPRSVELGVVRTDLVASFHLDGVHRL